MWIDDINQWVCDAKKIHDDCNIPINKSPKEILPHRGTALLLSDLDGISANKKKLKVTHSFCNENPIFEGHFPGDPVVPGIFLIELVAQSGVCLVHLNSYEEAGAVNKIRATRVLYSEFSGEVKPNDKIEVLVQLLDINPFLSVFSGTITCDSNRSAIIIVEVYIEQ